jgi:hypothetical protein
MITTLFRAIGWINRRLQSRMGPLFNVLLCIGLVIEIAHHVREAGERHYAVTLQSALSIVLFLLLLLHQLAELGEHVERRLGRRLRPGTNPD